MGIKGYDQLVLFGDSITEWSTNTDAGFALQPALQLMYNRRLDVVNRGFSGYNTSHALHMLPSLFSSGSNGSHTPRIRLLVIFFGANDACLPDNPTGQHVPLAQYADNLRAIAMHPAVVAHAPRIALVTPPPIDEAHLEESGFEAGGRTASNTAAYAAAARQMAAELAAENSGVVCCDLWSVFMREATGGGGDGSGGWPDPLPGDARAPRNEVLRTLLSDGLHFTPDAYRLWFETMRDLVLESFPDLDPDALPMVFPPWREAPKI